MTFFDEDVPMGLDYWSGCVNFRDVGESLELIADRVIFPIGRLYRGGKIDFVSDFEQIKAPATILNLRRGEDPETFPATYAHISASNDLEKYDTTNRDVRRWLNEVMTLFADPDTQLPVLVHCTFGKDRTGVVVAAVLLIMGIECDLIVEEYLMSEGETREDLFHLAIDGMDDLNKYFNRVDLDAVRQRFSLEAYFT